MALSLQQLVTMIRDRGATLDAKRVDDTFLSLDGSMLRAFGQDFGAMHLSVTVDGQQVTLRSALRTIATDLKVKRSPYAQQDALDRAVAILEKESG